MKKALSLLLTLVMCLSLCACGETTSPSTTPSNETAPASTEATPTEAPTEPVEEEPEVEAIPVEIGSSISCDSFEMTLDKVELLDEYSYETGDYSSSSLYVEEGYKLLMLKGHFTNNGTSAISDSAFVRTALVNDSYFVDGFDVRMSFLRSKYFEIDAYTDIDYVIYINIPEKLAGMFESVTFTIGYNNDLSTPVIRWNEDGTQTQETDNLYSITCGLGGNTSVSEGEENKAEETMPAIEIGQTLVTDDCEFTLKKVELSYEILPPNTSSVYTSYPAESGKVYVHVEADVKNTMQRDIRIDELFTTSVLYDGKYPYEGFTIVNDGDNSFDWVSSYVAATPLETCRAHGLVECPAEVDTSGKSISVRIELGDTTYEYILR